MSTPAQMSLFDAIPTYNIERNTKEALAKAAKNSGLSREEIVEQMNRIADMFGIALTRGKDSRLSLDVLDKWLNTSDLTRSMPVRALPIFCKVVNNPEPLQEIVRPLGLQIINDSERRLLEWAKAYKQARRAQKTMKRLEAYLGED